MPLLPRLIAARRAWQGVLLVLVAVISYIAVSPSPPQGPDLGWDKANHLAAFIVLAVAACLGFPGSRARLAAIALALLAFGAGIELVQLNVPGRDAEWADLLADGAGIALGCWLGATTLRVALAARAQPSSSTGSPRKRP